MSSSAQKRLSSLVNAGQQSLLQGGLVGLEKESLRVDADGSIAHTPHPAALGSALTNPWITTDYSEALLEFITPPLSSPKESLQFLHDVQHYVYKKLDDELLWASSMPCVVAGEEGIPIAQYGSSNIGLMKTVYRRGLGYRYGRVMQVIAGAHFNYSFPENFWPVYQQLEGNDGPLQDFISDCYFHLIRNIQRIGWLVPYLFGSSPAVCKSFMCGKPTRLGEFNENSFFGEHATSLRMCDIGYQNNFEKEVGFKAAYDSLEAYVSSLTRAIETPCPRFEKIGVKVNGRYRQLNTNILQIENEYYSSVRPKQVPETFEKPTLALQRRGVRYVELRSLDINVFDPRGISETQCRFLETLMAFCLMQDSPAISEQEHREIDHNQDAVCYQGREPGLELQRNGKSISLARWAGELCEEMTGFAEALDDKDNAYRSALQAQADAVKEPDATPSARILEEMRSHGEGYFHFAKRISTQHQKYFLEQPDNSAAFDKFAAAVKKSVAEQRDLDNANEMPFEDFLKNYFAQKP